MKFLKEPRVLFVIGLVILAIGVSVLAFGITDSHSFLRTYPYPPTWVTVEGNQNLISLGSGLIVAGIGILVGSVIWKRKQ